MALENMISVIMPVYNVEDYLPQAVESVLGQDYEHLELILIDDGSGDGSGSLCDGYAAADPRVKVIHQKNGGAAAAKNAGLRVAWGEYLSFVDSDDYLEPNVYSYMAEILQAEQADVVHCAFRNVYRDRAEDFVLHPGRNEVDPISYLKRFHKDWTCALLWNKLYKRSLFEGIYFEQGHRIDDEYFTYQGILNAKKIIVDDKIVYNYRRRASSAMHDPKARERLIFDRVDYLDKRRRIVAARYPELKWDFDFGFMDALIYLAESPDNTPATIAMLKGELKTYLRDRENTRPPRYLWKPLLKLYFGSTEKMLAKHSRQPEQTDPASYFL